MAAAFSHVIFDLDGTILNTLEDLAAASNHTCEMHGWPTFAVDEYRYKVGNGMLKLVERFMPAEYAGDGRMFEQTLAEFRAYYGEHKETTPHPTPARLRCSTVCAQRAFSLPCSPTRIIFRQPRLSRNTLAPIALRWYRAVWAHFRPSPRHPSRCM